MTAIGHLKTVLIGETRVGKTSLIQRFVSKTFNDLLFTTIAGAASSVEVKTAQRTVALDIWDTAGQEQYRTIAGIYFRNTSSVVMVFDVANRESFESLHYWYDTVKKSCDSKVHIYVAGNKVDLATRAVEYSEGEEFAKSVNAQMYLECSAKSGVDVEELFAEIAADPGVELMDGGVETVVQNRSGCC
jgi:Ras-related protein Rab-6A